MFNAKDEQGYALLTVLLIVSVFMIMFLSFIGRSFSSVKQNQVVEKSSQSVALAEMGLTYYQVAVQNIYLTHQLSVSNQVKQTIVTDRNGGASTLNSAPYVKLGVRLMKMAIKEGLANEQASISIDGKPKSSFSIYEINYYEGTEEPMILLKIKGEEDGKVSILSTIMTFAPTISGLNSGGISANIYTLPNFNSIQPPLTTDPNYCKNPSVLGNCTSVYNEGPKTFSENNVLSGRTIFSTGSLTFPNVNHTDNAKIHSEGTIIIGKSMNNAFNVVLESNGPASFGSQLKVDTSKLYFNGNLIVDGKLDLQNRSIVYVSGDSTIGNHLNIFDSGSRLCVGGNLTYQKNGSKIGGLLVVKGNINGVKTPITGMDFQTKCGTPSTPVLNVQWGDKVLNQVNYEY